MDLWESIKSVAIKAKCGIGFHDGVFNNPLGKPSCYFEKMCPDCKEIITEHRHEFEPNNWEDAPYDNNSNLKCTKIRKCTQCHSISKKVIHSNYQKLGINGKCQEVLACGKCGHEKNGDYSHNFARQGKTDDGRIVMKCTDCGEQEVRKYL
jgi:hypothetical protein